MTFHPSISGPGPLISEYRRLHQYHLPMGDRCQCGSPAHQSCPIETWIPPRLYSDWISLPSPHNHLMQMAMWAAPGERGRHEIRWTIGRPNRPNPRICERPFEEKHLALVPRMLFWAFEEAVEWKHTLNDAPDRRSA